MNRKVRSYERSNWPNFQESSITFKNVFERSKKEDVRERYSIYFLSVNK